MQDNNAADKPIGELDLDILQELGNIGANNAATATAQLLGGKINVSLTKAKRVDVKDMGGRMGPPETVVGAVFVRIVHALAGGILILMPKASALAAVDMFTGKQPGETQTVHQMDPSAFREFGNIVTGAYISAIANFLDIRLDQSVPYTAFDMSGAIVDFIAIEIAKFSRHAILVRTEFSAETIKGETYLILDGESAARLLAPSRKKIGE